MYNFTLMALRAMACNADVSGRAISIKGICDTIEEYLGVNRDIFRRECIRTRGILDGALLMWQKKERKMSDKYLANEASYEDMTEIDVYYINLHELYLDKKYDTKTIHTFVYEKTLMFDDYDHIDLWNSIDND
jgi:hypothetical protein